MTSTQIHRILRIGANAAESKMAWVNCLRDFKLRNQFSGSLREIHIEWIKRKIQRNDRWVLWATKKINSLPCE